ncbi:transglutaminase N-terminal domain-containing protein [Cyanobium sp. NIES-981]|uniref:transglutaminase N-terminal domain-containing protein n=1 Tax=Cyanobium sp. NIES-981 TaxID=1851505 RepID=UPI001CED1A3D
MQSYRIRHHTSYTYNAEVRLHAHALRLRPREGHELRIEASWLHVSPTAMLRWHRDAEDNSVAIATFSEPTCSLTIESEVLIQQYHEDPLAIPKSVCCWFPISGPWTMTRPWSASAPASTTPCTTGGASSPGCRPPPTPSAAAVAPAATSRRCFWPPPAGWVWRPAL